MKITIFLIALFIANEADNRGHPLFAFIIVLAALWEAFLRDFLAGFIAVIRKSMSRPVTGITRSIMALRRILVPRLLGKEKFQQLFNPDGSPRHENHDNGGLNLKQFFLFYVVVVILVLAIGIDDIALFFAESVSEYMGKPLSEELIFDSKMLVYVALGGGLFTLLGGAIIDLIFGKGTFSLD